MISLNSKIMDTLLRSIETILETNSEFLWLQTNCPHFCRPSGYSSVKAKCEEHGFWSQRHTTGIKCHFCNLLVCDIREGYDTPLQYSCLENPMDGGAWWASVHGVAKSQTWLSDFTFTFHFHALEKEMATHSSVLAWRIPGMAEPGGLPSTGSHRVGHDWSDLAVCDIRKEL